MNVVLIGFKSCGKSTLSERAARASGRDFVDTDTLLEQRYAILTGEALTCREIYAKAGAERMRELEAEALEEALDRENCVIATGGGVVLHPANVAAMRSRAVCVFIDTPLAVLEDRLAEHRNSPLFASWSVADMHTERYPLYEQAAHVRLCLDGTETAEAAAAILNQLVEEFRHGQ